VKIKEQVFWIGSSVVAPPPEIFGDTLARLELAIAVPAGFLHCYKYWLIFWERFCINRSVPQGD
jgi:hypothetical protein